MNRLVFFLLIIAFTDFSAVFGQITLEECHDKARNNFPLIKQYELIERTREYTLSNANKAYLPQLDVTIIGGIIDGLPSFNPSGSESSSSEFNAISVLQLNQLIWDGGITKAKKGIVEAKAEIDKAELEVSLFSLEERINNLFFGVLLIEEQLEQVEILKSTLLRNSKRIEIAIENGTAFKSDADEIEVELINADQKLEELQSNKKVYIHVLAAMIGEYIDTESKFARPEIEKSFLEDENNRPELSLFKNQKYLVDAQSQIDKAFLYPKVGLLGFGTFIQPGVDFGPSQVNNIFVGGLSINWSLGSLYTNGNNKKLSEVNLQKVAVQEETFLFNNNLGLTQAKLELDKFKKLIGQDEEILELKNRIKNAYEVKYKNGISTMSELLDKTNEENMARQKLITHEIQYLMKVYEYKNKTGN